ncbi:MAG: radical SAM protein [Pirellulales bacterium]
MGGSIPAASPPRIVPLYAHHERRFEDYRYVYPVLSRRSGGLSIGVNLNPDKICNFDCVYCQVDRRIPGGTRFVGLPDLLRELEGLLRLAVSGQIFSTSRFRDTPPPLRRVNDIAFSGDGEPTSLRNFGQVVEACAAVKRRLDLPDVKLVLITNASLFQRPAVQQALEVLDRNQGEIWAKLDAGTDAYFRQIDRTPMPLARIVANITLVARRRPVVIQSLFLRWQGEPPTAQELAAYCDRLCEIQAGGGQIKLVQVYTVARRPAEDAVGALRDDEVDAIRDLVQTRTGLRAHSFYGMGG